MKKGINLMETTRKEALEGLVIAARTLVSGFISGPALTDSDMHGMNGLRDALRLVETAKPDPCQPKYEGEPSFTLVGRDRLAVETISHWLYLAEQQGVEIPGGKRMDEEKFADACEVLEKFTKWRDDNPTKMKLPD